MEKEVLKNSKNLISDTNTEFGSQNHTNKKVGKDEQNKKNDNFNVKESNKEILIYENFDNSIQRETNTSNKSKIQNIVNNQNDINKNINNNIKEDDKIKNKKLEKKIEEKNNIEKSSSRKELKNKNKSKKKRTKRHRCDYVDCCSCNKVCCLCFCNCNNCCSCESCSCNYFCRYCCENSSRRFEIF